MIITVTILATSIIPAFAAGSYTYTSQAQALYDLGLYKGSSPTTFEPDLGSALDRQQGVVMLIRLLGKESAALALSSSEVESTLIIFSDAKDIASWAKKHIAYAVLYKYVAGLPNGTFAPNNPLSGKEFCTMLLRALGYTVDAAAYAGACYQLSNIGAITFAEAAKFNEKELIRDDMVGIAYGVLKAEYKTTGKTVIETMVEQKIVTEAKAISAGVYNQKLEKDARAAIEAYKTGSISTLAEIEAVEKKKAAADAAVAKIVDEATKKNLQKEIDTRAAEVAAARKGIEDADKAEKEAIAAAEAAVKAYESASLATSADVTKAEGLKKDAVDKANLVKTESSKKAFLNRIEAQDKKIADRKVDLANIADATAAVDAYLVAAYDTVEKVAEAERLGILAEEKVAKIVDTEAKASLTKKIDDHKKLVAAKKIELSSAEVAVTVDNFKVMKIVFSKPMNLDTINTTNIKLNDGSKVYKIEPTKSPDKKTFYLEYAEDAKQSDEIKLTITGVKDANGVTLTAYEKTFVVKDITDPVVKSVQAIDAKTVRIYTSEPVRVPVTDANTFAYFNGESGAYGIKMTLDGNIVWANVSQDYYNGYVQLDFSSPLTAGTRTLVVSGLRDFAGFATSGTFTFQVASDKAAPVATSAAVIGKNKVEVTFNENIANAGGVPYSSSGAFYVVEAGYNATLESDRNYATYVEYKDNKAILTLQKDLTLVSTIGLDVYYNYVSDATGNTVSTEAKLATKAVDDVVKPTVANVTVQDNNAVVVTFSEKVNINKIYDLSKFKVLYSNNKVWIAAATTIQDYDVNNPDGKTFIVTFSGLTSEVNGGNYKIEIGSIKDASIRENEMEAKQFPIYVKDTAAPKIAVMTKKLLPGSQTAFSIDVNFTEEMDKAYILEKVNYFIAKEEDGKDTTPVPLNSLPNTSYITLSTYDNKKVTITFSYVDESDPKQFKFTDTIKLYVLARDLSGNTAIGEGAIGSLKKVINEGDTVTGDFAFDKSDINSIKATARNKITITLNTNADGSIVNPFANAPIDLKALDLVLATRDKNNFYATGQSVIGDGVDQIRIIGATVSADGKTLDLTLNRELDPYGRLIKKDTNEVLGYLVLRTVSGPDITPIKDRNGVSLVIEPNYGSSTAETKAGIKDGIKPVQLSTIEKKVVIKTSSGQSEFDPVTKLATNNFDIDETYIKLSFNEDVMSKSTFTADMAQGIEVYIGTTKLTPGIHYYTAFGPKVSQVTANSEKDAKGTEIYVKFASGGAGQAKGKLLEDLSNLTVKISNAAYIVDADGNTVVPR